MWDKLKTLFGAQPGKAAPLEKAAPEKAAEPAAPEKAVPPKPAANSASVPDVGWLPDGEKQWGVPVLDVRPVAQTMISTSANPQMAANAISYSNDDGLGFAAQEPASSRITAAELDYPTDGLFDGVLFAPREMEDKWALFLHSGRLLVVRSWTRELWATAAAKVEAGRVRFGPIRGSFVGPDEPPALTVRTLDFLLRSHALNQIIPAPLAEPPVDLKRAALWSFSIFGRRALLASVESPRNLPPLPLLRSDSLLHIAIARGETDAVLRHVKAGVPLSLLDRGGLPAMQWAVASRNPEMLAFLIQLGGDIDARSHQGATALMTAVQSRSRQQIEELLLLKANVNAQDSRGFTALHRAAEMGKEDLVRLLLEHGADKSIDAAGLTALALAQRAPHAAIVEMLK